MRLTVSMLCATAAIAIVVLLGRSFDRTTWRILGTTTAVSVAALLAVPAGVLLERGTRRLLARTSALLTFAGFALTVGAIWHTGGGAWVWKTWAVTGTLALAAAQACGVESRRRDSDTPATRALVTASAFTGALLAALGIAAILAEIGGSGFYRALGALAIVDVLLLVLVAVLRRSSGPIDRTHRLRLNGMLVESPGRDFAAAVAAAIREAERAGTRVDRIERA